MVGVEMLGLGRDTRDLMSENFNIFLAAPTFQREKGICDEVKSQFVKCNQYTGMLVCYRYIKRNLLYFDSERYGKRRSGKFGLEVRPANLNLSCHHQRKKADVSDQVRPIQHDSNLT